ncbi:MAG: succinylglutamate desuccinylase/aspartoacylase family protein [Rhizobiales bacterium]|nr:succinylglutamate desuccinylase/aspartoacylase family protein [Hyphomicrobiales bacterium]
MTILPASFAETRDGPLEIIRFAALEPGPKLLVLGAVHGDETCGPKAIDRAIADIRAGRVDLVRGEVTFLPIANRKAYRQRTRAGDRNLNRDLRDKPVPLDHEDRVGNRLCALLRAHDALLDIHSFRGEGEPFVFCGPQNNTDALEPFRHAAAEGDFAARLGVAVVMHGWLDVYRRLIDCRARLGLPPLLPTEGHGTTEYMRFAGGYGVTLECGRHADPASVEIGYAAIRRALAHLALIDAPKPDVSARLVIRVCDIVICEAQGDRLEGVWKTGDPVAAGAVLARRADGTQVRAPSDGYVVFPDAAAQPGQSICYFGVASERRLAVAP